MLIRALYTFMAELCSLVIWYYEKLSSPISTGDTLCPQVIFFATYEAVNCLIILAYCVHSIARAVYIKAELDAVALRASRFAIN